MLNRALIDHCAPTLAGLKTGSIFTIRNEEKEDIRNELRELNHSFTRKGLRIVPIRRTEKNTLIYVFRPEQLRNDLKNKEAARILSKKGYHYDNSECCLVQLVKHLTTDTEFPHEIGLFLGYPPSDVRCFMKNPSKGVKCTGCWKAFSHKKDAEKTFAKYDKCTRVYRLETDKGRSLDQLTVDTNTRKLR